MRMSAPPPTASRQQRATFARLAREHGTRGRIVVREGASQTLRVLLADARTGQSVQLTITRGGFLA